MSISSCLFSLNNVNIGKLKKKAVVVKVIAYSYLKNCLNIYLLLPSLQISSVEGLISLIRIKTFSLRVSLKTKTYSTLGHGDKNIVLYHSYKEEKKLKIFSSSCLCYRLHLSNEAFFDEINYKLFIYENSLLRVIHHCCALQIYQ